MIEMKLPETLKEFSAIVQINFEGMVLMLIMVALGFLIGVGL